MLARMLVIGLLLGGSVGCGWLSSAPDPAFSEGVEITEPWSGMALPVSGAEVTFSDAETVSVRHPSGEPEALKSSYAAALEGAGWKLERDTSSAGIVSQTWSKGEDSLSLALQEKSGSTFASLSILPF